MNSADFERLRTWILQIAEVLLPDVTWRQEGSTERRAIGTKLGLSINTVNGAWFPHAAGGGGGWSPISLIKFLTSCSHADAVEWAAAWLKSHPGTGSALDTGDETAAVVAAELTQRLMAKLVPAHDTAAELNLRQRGITAPLPDSIKFWPNARCGEGALVGMLVANHRVVGFQAGYITIPDGQKSLVRPYRRRFMLEQVPGAVFDFPPPGDGVVSELTASLCIAEGLEDALSIHQLGRSWHIIGLPGIAALRHLPVRQGERVLVCRDGDEPGSPADKALPAGIDHLLLQGATVSVTTPAIGDDANSVLQAGGADALLAMLNQNSPAALSREGEIERLSRLDPLDYDRERKTVAHELRIRLGTLDDAVNKRRSKTDAGFKPVADAVDVDEIELLDEPIDLGATFDAILEELKRYIVAPELSLATVVVWSAHTHLCHHDKPLLSRSPRLAAQGRSAGSGKTILLTAISALVPRPRLSSSVTASTVLRIVGELRPTLLIDEADRVLRDHNSDLLAILNAGDRRLSGFVERSIPTPDGGWEVKRFPVFGPVAFAGIDELPATQQDRSIVIHMQRALFSEVPGYLEDGDSPELTLGRRRLATWAADLDDLPRPDLPEVLRRQAGRTGDNWRWLIAIADLAGERWSNLIRDAALAAVETEVRPSLISRLLDSVQRMFAERATNTKGIPRQEERLRITTPELIAWLHGDSEEEWTTINRGRAVTAYWLRDNLRQLLDPSGAAQWEGQASSGRRGKRYRGYYRSQFDNAIKRYLTQTSLSSNPYETSEVSGVSDVASEVIDNAEFYPGEPTPDAESSGGPLQGKASDVPPDTAASVVGYLGLNPVKSTASLDTPDTPDVLQGSGKDIPRPNGPDTAFNTDGRIKLTRPTHREPRTDLERDILDYARTLPGASVKEIANTFGQPPAVVAELLGRAL